MRRPKHAFVAPLAGGIVERRGGMLIHGAIIAREYGLPGHRSTRCHRADRHRQLITVDWLSGHRHRADGGTVDDHLHEIQL